MLINRLAESFIGEVYIIPKELNCFPQSGSGVSSWDQLSFIDVQ